MTYGVDAPKGFQWKHNRDNTPMVLNSYPIASAYATAIGRGDPVTQLNDGTIGRGVAGSAIIGVLVGVKYTLPTGEVVNAPNWTASTTLKTGTQAEAQVIDNPTAVFSIQETDASGDAGTALALADRNLNTNFVIGAPDSLGNSTTSLSNAAEHTTATLNCKILDLDPTPGNVVGSFANWLVMINNHQLKGGTGTAGV